MLKFCSLIQTSLTAKCHTHSLSFIKSMMLHAFPLFKHQIKRSQDLRKNLITRYSSYREITIISYHISFGCPGPSQHPPPPQPPPCSQLLLLCPPVHWPHISHREPTKNRRPLMSFLPPLSRRPQMAHPAPLPPPLLQPQLSLPALTYPAHCPPHTQANHLHACHLPPDRTSPSSVPSAQNTFLQNTSTTPSLTSLPVHTSTQTQLKERHPQLLDALSLYPLGLTFSLQVLNILRNIVHLHVLMQEIYVFLYLSPQN